jgi:antitoxin HicB
MRKTRKVKNPHIGGSFDDFLKEEGIYEAVQTTAIKRVLASQLEQAMKSRKLTKLEMARRMRTSRVQLNRLLDPDNDSVTLATLRRAAAVVGREVRLELV